jgi:hypothetical protein
MHKLEGVERESLLQTILQSKKGMPRPERSDLIAGVLKTVSTLLTEPKDKSSRVFLTDWADWPEEAGFVNLTATRAAADYEIRRTVRELFTDQHYTYADRFRPLFPSTSANYIRSRTKGGAVGEILTHPTLMEGLRSPGGCPVISGKTTLRNGEEEREQEHWVDYDSNELERRCRVLYNRIVAEALKEEYTVEPVPLEEPLKVRIITKGPPFTQTMMKPLQKFLHNVLRKHKTFRLIGTPVNEEEMLNGLGYHLKDDHYYLSGDYAAATDNLESWATAAAWNEIADLLSLTDVERVAGLALLLHNRFDLSEIEEISPETAEYIYKHLQANGQLMGTITSFPILCIINAAVCRWAMEVSYKRVFTLKDAPLMVNGDDCALKGPWSLQGIWRRTTALVGLDESIGKSFFTRKFVNMNSTSFMRIPEESPDKIITVLNQRNQIIVRHTRLTQTPYVNMAILYGFKRSQGGAGMKELDARQNIGARARELLALAPTSMQMEVMRGFIEYNRGDLSSARLPWYIPEWLGGFGLPTGSWGEPSDIDRRVAHLILLNWKTRRPIPMNTVAPNWMIMKAALKRLPPTSYYLADGPATELYKKVVGQECINTLFDSNYSFRDLFKENKSTTQGLITENLELWKPPKKALPTPLTDAELTFRPLRPGYETTNIRQIGSFNTPSAVRRHSIQGGLD